MKYIMAVLLALLMVSMGASAHHSRAHIDTRSKISITGVIEEYTWASPHIYFKVRSEDENGNPETWLMEGNNPPALSRMNWSADSLQSGMRVTVTGSPTRDRSKKLMMFDQVDFLDSGGRLYGSNQLFREANAAAEQAVVVPSEDFTGIWTRVLDVDPTKAGVFDPPTDWPVTEAGQYLLDTYNPLDNPPLYCLYYGSPRGLNYAYGLEIRLEQDRIVFDKELRSDDRIVYLNQDEFPTEIPPSIWGYSIGELNGRELTVQSRGFLPEIWGLAPALDSSSRKEVTEHWKLSEDGLSISVEFVLSDPIYLEEPVSVFLKLGKAADRELIQETCDLEQAAKYKAEEY